MVVLYPTLNTSFGEQNVAVCVVPLYKCICMSLRHSFCIILEDAVSLKKHILGIIVTKDVRR